jgi:hypothetical protein
MKQHSKIEEEIKKALESIGNVEIEPVISIDFGSRRYRPDLVFENRDSNKKIIIEIKANQMGFSLSATSYVVELKNFLDNNTDYKFALILTNELTPNISRYIKGRVNYFSLQEHSIDDIKNGIIELTK